MEQAATSSNADAPLRTVRVGDTEFKLLGTAHVSRASVDDVRREISGGGYDAVAVELCSSRYLALTDPQHLQQMDLLKVLRDGKAGMVAASLALGAYQRRLAEQFDIEPGAEMKAALDGAADAGLPHLLIDRDLGITLKRIAANLGWWQRLTLLSGLAVSALSRERISEEEIERLKEGDMLESTFTEFAERSSSLYQPLIEERDRFMAAQLLRQAGGRFRKVLVVIGAGHLAGIARELQAQSENTDATITQLSAVPERGGGLRLLPWLIVAAVLAGFAYGFSRDFALGWTLVADWVLINGALCAVGSALALAHPITIVVSFLAAPITSLNPTIGAGMVTAAVELALRRPRVGDFAALRGDVARLSGWWRNRVARVLLVFVLSSLGSAIGTYVAGFRIAERLLG